MLSHKNLVRLNAVLIALSFVTVLCLNVTVKKNEFVPVESVVEDETDPVIIDYLERGETNSISEIDFSEDESLSENEVLVATALPKSYIDMTDDDINELATLVYLEAGAESYECKMAVASVVINRMTYYDQSLQNIIYEPNQFTPAYLIPFYEPSESSLRAVKEVVSNGPTLPEYVTYFRADHYFDWGDRYVNYINIDHTYFSYDTWIKDDLETT